MRSDTIRALGEIERVELAESKRDLWKCTRDPGVCDNLFETVCNLLILKRRDAGAVDQARLESEAVERHRATPKHVNADVISELAVQNDSSVCVCKPRCSSRF